jgi:copper chaperone CopZ
MRLTSACLAGVLALLPLNARAAERVATLKVDGWYDSTSAEKTAKVIEAQPGVITVKSEYATRTLVVVFDDKKTDLKTLQQAVRDAGFAIPEEDEL